MSAVQFRLLAIFINQNLQAKPVTLMKCVAVSDIHMREVVTPEADLLIVAGDMTFHGDKKELDWFADWLKRQPQKHKVWIAGNHEVGLEKNPKWAPSLAKETGTVYLEDNGIEIEGLKIWGSPVTPFFFAWAFNRQRGEDIRAHWKLIPEGLDILITHGPPFGYLDDVPGGEHVGCEDLLDVVKDVLYEPPRVVIFGHIHNGYGEEILEREDGTKIHLINAASCDEHYRAVNPPIVFELAARKSLPGPQG